MQPSLWRDGTVHLSHSRVLSTHPCRIRRRKAANPRLGIWCTFGGRKYVQRRKICHTCDYTTDGTVQRKDVVGAIFGQTEGLLGEDLQLRALQRNGRIGHVDVHLNQRKGSVNGEITLTTSMDQVSTSVIGAALETIDRIRPCKASIRVQRIENVVSAKRDVVIDRAKSLLMDLIGSGADESKNILEEVRSVLAVDTEISINGMIMGPNVKKDGIIIVEGRNDVRNLLKYGIKNAIAMMGAGVVMSLWISHLRRRTSQRS